MAQAHDILVRESVLLYRKRGYTMRATSDLMNISYDSVRTVCQRYAACDPSEEGHKSALLPRYDKCGPQEKYYSLSIVEAALALKRLHPRWGAPRLHLALVTEFSAKSTGNTENAEHAEITEITEITEKLPSIRTLERWFREYNLVRPKRQTGEPSIGRARAVHNIWEVDAKEQLELLDGQAACYLTMVDEKSGAWLASPVFTQHRHNTRFGFVVHLSRYRHDLEQTTDTSSEWCGRKNARYLPKMG